MNITIREMGVEDIDAVMEIERRNFEEPWSDVGFLTHLMREDALYLVAEDEIKTGSILGYIGVIMVPDEADITKVSVSEDMRNKGIAQMLIGELIKRVHKNGINKLYLEVRENNDSAIHVYKKQGFEEIGRRKNYYNGEHGDALNMMLDITDYSED